MLICVFLLAAHSFCCFLSFHGSSFLLFVNWRTNQFISGKHTLPTPKLERTSDLAFLGLTFLELYDSFPFQKANINLNFIIFSWSFFLLLGFYMEKIKCFISKQYKKKNYCVKAKNKDVCMTLSAIFYSTCSCTLVSPLCMLLTVFF